MAKISFTKLDMKINNCVKELTYENPKGEKILIEVKYYLPVEEKLEMISRIINQSIDDNGYYNPMRVKIFTTIEIVYAYTNLNFTPKQKENSFKLYDQLVSTGVFQQIRSCIFENDLKDIEDTIITTVENIYKYKNSAMGIFESITEEYGDLNLDATNIYQSLADPSNMEFLKNVLAKLG